VIFGIENKSKKNVIKFFYAVEERRLGDEGDDYGTEE